MSDVSPGMVNEENQKSFPALFPTRVRFSHCLFFIISTFRVSFPPIAVSFPLNISTVPCLWLTFVSLSFTKCFKSELKRVFIGIKIWKLPWSTQTFFIVIWSNDISKTKINHAPVVGTTAFVKIKWQISNPTGNGRAPWVNFGDLSGFVLSTK